MSLQNKHAYLIIAHNEYPVLRTLLSMLDDERNDIYLYIDRRSRNLRKSMHHYELSRAKLYIIPNPIKLYWGDISLVEAEFTLLETASANGKYAYYHLLSGVDLPLKNQNYIHDFFDRHAGQEFVEYWHSPEHQKDLDRKVSRYYLFTKSLRPNDRWLSTTLYSSCKSCSTSAASTKSDSRKARNGSASPTTSANICSRRKPSY